MKRRLLTTSAIIAAGLAALTVSAAAPAGIAADTPSATPQHVDDFQLTDQTRLAQRLYYFNYVPAIVVMTRTNGSAVSKSACAGIVPTQTMYSGRRISNCRSKKGRQLSVSFGSGLRLSGGRHFRTFMI